MMRMEKEVNELRMWDMISQVLVYLCQTISHKILVVLGLQNGLKHITFYIRLYYNIFSNIC